MPGRGKGKCLFLKGASTKGFSFHFLEISLFLCKRLISTAEAHFYGGDVFLRRGHISTAEVYFYGGGVSLRRKCISMKEVNLKAIDLSLVWKRGTNARRR